MRKILLVILVATLPASIAAAQSSALPKPDKSASSGKLLPLKGAASRNSCAAYGPGFAKVAGTDTCVKIGGAVSVGVGSSGNRR